MDSLELGDGEAILRGEVFQGKEIATNPEEGGGGGGARNPRTGWGRN
jgi:hypothetical protein